MKEEVLAPDRKNPMPKVKAPKVVLDPLESISIQDVQALINTCQRGDFIGKRDRVLFSLDTGSRAREACHINQNGSANSDISIPFSSALELLTPRPWLPKES